jgi:protein TonB
MKSLPSFLGRALALSLILHASVIAIVAQYPIPALRAEQAAKVELKVSLREPPAELELPAQPQLLLPEVVARNANATTPARASRSRLEGEAAQMAMEQLRRELPYPPEAIERGLQGEALVLLFLDTSGNAIAARLESSSGHALLDEAALRAARSLRALPDSAPREALFPVRFRLR